MWLDGYEVPTNGSLVGYDVPPFCEQTIVHGGKQSMPFFFSNTVGAAYSEAERTFTVAQDWTKSGVQALVLYFYGDAGNTGQLYVKINGSKVVYDNDAADIAKPRWKQWNIDLASLGAGLQNVTKLAIGIDGIDAAGTLLFDDIRLYRLAPENEQAHDLICSGIDLTNLGFSHEPVHGMFIAIAMPSEDLSSFGCCSHGHI